MKGTIPRGKSAMYWETIRKELAEAREAEAERKRQAEAERKRQDEAERKAAELAEAERKTQPPAGGDAEEAFNRALQKGDPCWLHRNRESFSVVAEPQVGEFYEIVSFNKLSSYSFSAEYCGYCVVNDNKGAIILGSSSSGTYFIDKEKMNVKYWCLQPSTNYRVSDKQKCDETPRVRAWKALDHKPATREAFNQWATVQKEFAERKKIYPTCWLHDADYKDLVPVTELTVGNFYVKVSKTAFIIPYSGYCVVNDDQGAIFLSGKVVAREAEDVPPKILKEESGFMKGNDYYLEYKKYNTEDDPRNLVQRIQRDQMPIVMAWKELNPKPNRKAFLKWAAAYLQPSRPPGNRGRRGRHGYVEFRF
jgi:hypothetical protein